MIITLSGITGVGKSYYKNYLVDTLGLENMVIYTTREKRKNEIDGTDKHFVTWQEMEQKKKEGAIFATYDLLGETYGYDHKYLNKDINSVTELHYEWMSDFKQKARHSYAIYMIPTDNQIAKKELQKRNLPNEVYQKRLQEIEQQLKKIEEDRSILNSFDAIFYNDYTEEAKQKMIQLIRNKLKM